MRNLISEYTEFYHEMTGFPEPYGYQLKVAEYIFKGKNIILSVPTGAGKTWASIMPFLFIRNQRSIKFPAKLIYSLPLRTLCNSISNDVSQLIKNTEFENISSIQTGEFSDDNYFEKDIVFSTIDQTLSNFLCFPLALSQRQANINAGALVGSYLIFDEFHLLDEQRSMATSIGMLRMLNNFSRFCIMTATLSDNFIQKIKQSFDNVEIVTLSDFKSDNSKIGSLKFPNGKQCKKEVKCLNNVINGKDIILSHKDKTIVICNRVETAQRIYLELFEWSNASKIKLFCFHSRFFATERKQTEKALKKYFGKKGLGNAILISTQVIEAGMDISCETMHTEIAPINAILQRAGRCARFQDEYGEIFIYDVLHIEEHAKIDIKDFNSLSKDDKVEIRKLKNKYLPYDEQLCKLTLTKLKLPENQNLTEKIATKLVNDILESTESEIWERISDGYQIDEIKNSWRASVENKFGAKHFYKELIRDIQSMEVVLIDNLELATKIPFAFESIGIYKWSLIKWIKEVFEANQDRIRESNFWIVGTVEEIDDIFLDSDQNQISYQFHKIKDFNEIKDVHTTLFLNNAVFSYHSSIGLNKERKGTQKSRIKNKIDKEEKVYSYQKDTFTEHTEALIGVFENDFFKGFRMDFVFVTLNKELKSNIDFKKLFYLILILHDYGKLNNKWQDWMQEYQEKLSQIDNTLFPFEKNIPLGHTGFAKREQKEQFGLMYESEIHTLERSIKNKRGKRPPHSGAGAHVIIDVLEKWLGIDNQWDSIFIPASYAIARHHGVSNKTCHKFNVSDYNFNAIQILLNKYGFKNHKIVKNSNGQELEDFNEYNQSHFLIYLFFVRILRLCDQKATENMGKYLLK